MSTHTKEVLRGLSLGVAITAAICALFALGGRGLLPAQGQGEGEEAAPGTSITTGDGPSFRC